MVDIRAYYMDALKVTWLRRLLVSSCYGWAFLCRTIIDVNHLLLVEGGSSNLFSPNNILFHSNQFWVDVFQSWQKFTPLHKPLTHSDVLKSILWFNDLIKVGNKCIYYGHWMSAGEFFICDLLDENGTFLSLNNFKIKFNIRTNFIEYGAVVRAVKFYFGEILSMENSNVERPFNFEVMLCDKKGSRRFYNIFISSKEVVRKYLDKWENKMQINFNLCKWSLVFKVPFTCTVDTKLRWFQFRLIHRILGTNSFLFKMNKVDSNACVFCKNEEETLIHLFVAVHIQLTVGLR